MICLNMALKYLNVAGPMCLVSLFNWRILSQLCRDEHGERGCSIFMWFSFPENLESGLKYVQCCSSASVVTDPHIRVLFYMCLCIVSVRGHVCICVYTHIYVHACGCQRSTSGTLSITLHRIYLFTYLFRDRVAQ